MEQPRSPKSPKEHPADLLALGRNLNVKGDFDTFFGGENSKPRSERLLHNQQNTPLTSNRSAGTIDRLNGPPRSAFDPVAFSKPHSKSHSKSHLSPSKSQRTPMVDSAVQRLPDMTRGPPRTSSIDSAISNMSTLQDSPGASSDIANLVQAAGSPEAVIQYLLKEKQSSAAQNSQLWRLVDKQRAMILGLNKDLERALRDKDRYRKKLKEGLAQVSNGSFSGSKQMVLPDNMSEISGPDYQRTDSRQSNVEVLASAREDNPHSPIDVALAPYPITPPGNSSAQPSPLPRNMVEAESTMPEPSRHAFEGFDADAVTPGEEFGHELKDLGKVEQALPYNASLPPSRSLPVDPPRKSPNPTGQTPTVSVTTATPQIDQEKTFVSPTRKAPPAPLNLKSPTISSHLHQSEEGNGEEESDSDYDDILEVDEIPAGTERGRRKTREEDERQRELAAQRDAGIQTAKKSPKAGGSKSTPKQTLSKFYMPASPRTVTILPPGDSFQSSPTDAAAGSLAGMLSASLDSGVTHQEFTLAPKSPGLPASPRPKDRPILSPLPVSRNKRDSQSTNISSPPMSPRSLAMLGSAMPPLSPRAPRQPIPLPPGTPMSLVSPSAPTFLQLACPKPLTIAKKPVVTAEPKSNDNTPSPTDDAIFKGFVTEEYPGLLLPPNALPLIEVKVASSRLKPSRASMISPEKLDEDPVFTLAVFARADAMELWRVEKDSMSLAQLDQQLKQSPYFTAKTPERALFSGHAPAKIDARSIALDRYFEEILNSQMDMPMAMELCRYLSTGTMKPRGMDRTHSDSPFIPATATGPGGRPTKNGYLTKRGKNFGGWKARFFVLDGPTLKYYESPGGPHLGAIKLQNAQIGKQQQQPPPPENQSPARGGTEDTDNQYRHAFLILEPKRKDSSSLVRHVLCAESDVERDQWVEALLAYVDFKDEEEGHKENSAQKEYAPNRSGNGSQGSNHREQSNGVQAKKKVNGPGRTRAAEAEDALRGVSYETTVAGEVPKRSRSRTTGTPSPPTHGNERDPMAQNQGPKQISGPKNAQIIQDSGSWGNKPSHLAPIDERKQQRKRSFFGFGTTKPRASSEVVDTNTSLTQMSYDLHGPIRPAFGAPLSEAVKYSHPVGVNIELPAVIYRCIEYLDAKNAQNEEGIFRLSGSNVVIKQLRERFQTEGDVNLVTDETYYDIHAVASLLKLFLRELPSTILTRELHIEFLAVTELRDVQEKIQALNALVHRLPRVNEALLRYLSGFLINIINHADINKMTVRNVGIVFSPTLNIPAPVFALFLQQYDSIFGAPVQESSVEVTVTAPASTSEDVRSPRRQKIQDWSTPTRDQQPYPQSQQQYGGSGPTQQPRYAGHYDQTGLAPMPQTMGGPEYGARGPTIAGPAYEQFAGSPNKSKRRESSMFTMGVTQGPKRAMRSNTSLNTEESFYES